MTYLVNIFSDSDVFILNDCPSIEYIKIGFPIGSEIWNQPDSVIVAQLKAARDVAIELDEAQRFLEYHTEYTISLDELNKALKNQFLSPEYKVYIQDMIDRCEERNQERKLKRNINQPFRGGIYKRDKGYCRYCGVEVPIKGFHIDHVIPYSLGGLTEESNLVLSCQKCNNKKAGRTLEQAGFILLPI